MDGGDVYDGAEPIIFYNFALPSVHPAPTVLLRGISSNAYAAISSRAFLLEEARRDTDTERDTLYTKMIARG